MAHRTGLLLARTQTGRVYDYAFFMLAGLFVALVLTDLVINPTSAAFLAESTTLVYSFGTQGFLPLCLSNRTSPLFPGWLTGS